MLRRLAASTLATIITNVQIHHSGIETAKLIQFAVYDLVDWANKTSHIVAGSVVGEIVIVADSCMHMPAGHMHARCVAHQVVIMATDAMGAIDWTTIAAMNPHQLTAYIAGKLLPCENSDDICEHTDPLEPIGDNESLFSL